MSQVARITLFVHDRAGRLETTPDQDLLHALLREVPFVTRHEDGSRTFVFDMVEPEHRRAHHAVTSVAGSQGASSQGGSSLGTHSLETLNGLSSTLACVARALDLPLTAALAESAPMVAAGELRAMQVPKQQQC